MIIRPIIPRDRAIHDVERAIDYYLDEGAAQAALDLIDALQAAYRLIGLHPGVGSPR
jgi:toxin ParE1/3/4